MGAIERFGKEKLICGVLTSRPELYEMIVDELTDRYGPVDLSGAPEPFTYTDYYDREMGTPIYRFFLSFEDLVLPDSLAAVKIATNGIEDRFAVDGLRPVNLDPGLISLQRLILASTKDNGRRIPLQAGIYAEITLIYVEGDYQPLDWTYPDFRSRSYRDLMKEIRQIYRNQLKHL
jgi:hypothetical protein